MLEVLKPYEPPDPISPAVRVQVLTVFLGQGAFSSAKAHCVRFCPASVGLPSNEIRLLPAGREEGNNPKADSLPYPSLLPTLAASDSHRMIKSQLKKKIYQGPLEKKFLYHQRCFGKVIFKSWETTSVVFKSNIQKSVLSSHILVREET